MATFKTFWAKPMGKLTVIGGSIILLSIFGFVIFGKKTNEFEEGTPESNLPSGSSDWWSTIKNTGRNLIKAQAGTAPAGTVFKVSEINEKTTGATDLVISFAVPRPKNGEINSGDRIKIANMGKYDGINVVYPIQGTWIDGAGNIGAIYVKTGKVTAANESNKSFPNATVTKIS